MPSPIKRSTTCGLCKTRGRWLRLGEIPSAALGNRQSLWCRRWPSSVSGVAPDGYTTSRTRFTIRVRDAERAIRERGEMRSSCRCRPDEAELAEPSKAFGCPSSCNRPGPCRQSRAGSNRARITTEVTIMPQAVVPRTYGPCSRRVPSQCTVRGKSIGTTSPRHRFAYGSSPPDGWAVSQRLLSRAESPPTARISVSGSVVV